jgi:hypothetical protein
MHPRLIIPQTRTPTTMRRAMQTALFCLLSLASARAGQIDWTNLAGGDWSAATNWSPNQVPGAADDAVIADPVNVTLSASISVLSLTLSGSAMLIPLGMNTSAQVGGLWAGAGVIIDAGNVTVEAGSAITANGQGYTTSAGPGAAAPGNYSAGGSYGGIGSGNDAPTYGDAVAPVDLGSAGGGAYGGYSAGGGAIELNLTGSLVLDGAISADGFSTGGNNGGAAGGSVYITTGTLAGAGAITANGNQGGNANGGGGRIAVYYANGSNYTGYSSCAATAGGVGAQNGTVVFFDTSLPNSGLYVYQQMSYSQGSALHFDSVTLGTNATLTIGGGSTLQVNGLLDLASNATALCGSLYNTTTNAAGEWVGVGVTINASNVTVEAGAAISANGQGYTTSAGPGAAAPGNYSAGGSYGGGGSGGSGPTYGDYAAPTDLGSAGGGAYGGYSAGGGAISLNVSGSLVLDGAISANGFSIGGNNGGAAGGSVYITTGTLAGTGAITANGNDGVDANGGGGRIAVYYVDASGYTGYSLCAAAAGGAGAQNGTAVFVDTSVPNNALYVYQQMDFGQDSALHFGSVTLGTNAAVALGGGSTLQVDGLLDLESNASVLCQSQFNSATNAAGQWAGLGVTINASNVTVGPGAAIIADGQGYTTGTGPGAPIAGGGDYSSGGSYGGGGQGHSGPTYGSYAAPTNLGSAGGGANGGYSLGGGAIALHVAGSLVVQGSISANGLSSAGGNAGGAAGGSVYITTTTLTGSGPITANGAQGPNAQGGGGRVAVYYVDASEYTGFTNCTAGGYQPGTVGFFDTTVPNLKLSVFATMDFSPDTWVNYGEVAMTNGATLSLEGGVTLQVNGSLSLADNSTVFAGGINRSAQVNGQWVGAGATISAGDLTIGAGSSLIADGEGYTTGSGPGGPVNGGGDYSSGGSYGGSGQGNSGPTYGNPDAPLDLGSAGGGAYGGYSVGGGAIALHIATNLVLDGLISANGVSAGGNNSGAAGGSVFITTGTMTGSGMISANGDMGGDGNGGGGRVAICCRDALTFATNDISVTAGGNGAEAGSLVVNAGVGACSAGAPVVNIALSNGQAVFHWSDPAFSLQAAPSLTAPYTNVPVTLGPYTNAATLPQQFFRLISN